MYYSQGWRFTSILGLFIGALMGTAWMVMMVLVTIVAGLSSDNLFYTYFRWAGIGLYLPLLALGYFLLIRGKLPEVITRCGFTAIIAFTIGFLVWGAVLVGLYRMDVALPDYFSTITGMVVEVALFLLAMMVWLIRIN